MSRFYVYTLARPDGRIFYIGKGCGNRVGQHEKEAKKGHQCYKCNVIRKIWRQGGEVKRSIVFCGSEQAAYDRERELIREFGSSGLTNRTGGGGAAAHWNFLSNKSVDEITEEDYQEYLERRPGLSPDERTKNLRLWRVQRYDRLMNDLRWLKLQRKHEQVREVQAEIDRLRPLVIESFDYEIG